MKILLVNPISRNMSLSSPDLGLGFLAAALKREHHDVQIMDCVNLRLSFEKFAEMIHRSDCDVIGFKVFSTDVSSVKKSVEIVKEKRPDAKIILGGAHPSACPEQIFRDFPQADYAFRGEAEKGLPALLKTFPHPDAAQHAQIPGLIWKNNQKVEINPPLFVDDLDSLGFPDWNTINPLAYPFQTSYLIKSRIVAPLLMTRGCPYPCTFCSCRSVTGRNIRSHSVDYMIRQIKYLTSTFGIHEFCFLDDNFLILKDHTEDLCKRIIEEKLDIRWSCFGIRLNLIDRDILKVMEQSGCYLLTVGIESGSQRILDHMKKNLTLGLIEEKLNLICRQTRIKVIGNFMMGYPQETEEDMKKTILFAGKLPLFGANFFPFHPLPGTPIHADLTARGELQNIDWNAMGQDRIPYVPRGISKKRFARLLTQAYLRFYVRPRPMFHILVSIRSPRRLQYIMQRILRILK